MHSAALRYARPSYMPKYWPVPSSCVLYLEGQQDPQSSTIKDLSGNGNNGTITGATWVRLPSGLWVLSHNGTSDYTTLSSPISLAEDTPWTVMFWFYRDANSDKYFYGNTFAVGSYTRFRFSNTFFYLYNDANENDGGVNIGPSDTTWHHLALVCDGTDANNIDHYIDTTLEGTTTLANSQQTIRVLGDIGDASVFFNGDLALWKVFDGKALTATEIQNHFNQERHLFNV